MPDTLLATRLWTGAAPAMSEEDNSGSGVFGHTAFANVGQASDGNDSTAASWYAGDDGSSVNADLTAHINRGIQTGTITGTISFVRIVVRLQLHALTGTNALCAAQWTGRFKSATPNTPVSLTSDGTFYELTMDQATDPADGLAWTSGDLNLGQWGIDCFLQSLDTTSYATTVEVLISEFKVEVWGDAGGGATITPASVGITAAASASTAAATGTATITVPAAIPVSSDVPLASVEAGGTVTGFPLSVQMNAAASASLVVDASGTVTLAPASVGVAASVSAATRSPSGVAVIAPASTGMVATPGAAAATSGGGLLLPASVGMAAAVSTPTMGRAMTVASVGALALVGAPALLPALVRLFPLSVGVAVSVGLPDVYIDTGQLGTTIVRDYAAGVRRVYPIAPVTTIGGD